jgi:transcriptional regulator with XRE-family HTH domain
MTLQDTFGRNLRRLRRERKISQEQLAHLADVSRAYLSGAEAGRRNATLETVEALAKALQIDPVDLLKDPATAKQEN